MDYMLLLLAVGAVVILLRIFQKVRALRDSREEDYDTRFVERLRRSGMDPFKPMDVDFFLAMPSLEAADRVSARLVEDLFTPDVRSIDGP